MKTYLLSFQLGEDHFLLLGEGKIASFKTVNSLAVALGHLQKMLEAGIEEAISVSAMLRFMNGTVLCTEGSAQDIGKYILDERQVEIPAMPFEGMTYAKVNPKIVEDLSVISLMKLLTGRVLYNMTGNLPEGMQQEWVEDDTAEDNPKGYIDFEEI